MSPGQFTGAYQAQHQALTRAARCIGIGVIAASLASNMAITSAFATDITDVEPPAHVVGGASSELSAVAHELSNEDGDVVSPAAPERKNHLPAHPEASGQDEKDLGLALPSSDSQEDTDSVFSESGGISDYTRLEYDDFGEEYLVHSTEADPTPEDLIYRGDFFPRAAFRQAVNNPFICDRGYVYSQDKTGVIRAFDPGTGQEKQQIAPSVASRAGDFNATGIAPDGSYALAVETRSREVRRQDAPSTCFYSNGALTPWGARYRDRCVYTTYDSRFWRYSASTGWKVLTIDGSADFRETGAVIVAGGISKETGDYYYGNYSSRPSGTGPIVFNLYRIPAGGNTTQQVATINIPTSNTSTSFNGDIAFDSEGNLFLVAARGSNITVASVTDEQLRIANGGTITAKPQSSGSVQVQNTNGIAFRADGSLYVGSSGGVSSHDPYDFNKLADPKYDKGGETRVDLASCDSPLTVLLQKNIVDRKEANDQFKLQLIRTNPSPANGTLPLEATTTGNLNDIQTETVGPMPIVAGQEYRMWEELVGAGNLATKYTTSWKCVTPTNHNFASGTTTDFRLNPGTIRGEQITCTFTNTPTGSITWEKRSDDPAKTLLSGSEWRLSSDIAGFTPLTIKDCTAANACAGTNDLDARAGYLKVDYLKDGTYTLVETKAPAGHNADTTPRTFVIGNAKRDHAAGAVTNPRLRSSILVKKTTFAEDGTTREDTARSLWTIGASLTGTTTGLSLKANEQNTAEQQTGSNGFVVSPWDIFFPNTTQTASLTLSETLKDGWDAKQLICVNAANNSPYTTVNLSSAKPVNGKVSTTITGLRAGTNLICEFQNARTPGSITWQKVAAGTSTLLRGSTWTLSASGRPTLTITDCVQAGRCAGTNDDDPTPGSFTVSNLLYRNYTLTETTAPSGYKRITTTRSANVTATTRNVNLGQIGNERLQSTVEVVKTTQHVDRQTADNTARGGWTITAALPTGTATGITLQTDAQNGASRVTANTTGAVTPWTVYYAAENQTASITLSETMQDGWDARTLVCTNKQTRAQIAHIDLTSVKPVNGKVSATVSGLAPGINLACEFTNARTRGSITWQKVETGTTTYLPGSTWTLSANSFTTLTITDCTAANQCAGTNDEDPRPGHFTVSNLLYRNYTLTETTPPTGYKIDNARRTVNVDKTNRDHNLGAIGNLPLKATMRLVKETRDVDGTVMTTERQGWTLGATLPTGASNSIKANGRITPTQNTQANGTLPHEWGISLRTTADRQPIIISEPTKDGWKPLEVVCTRANGTQFHRADLTTLRASNGRLNVTTAGITADENVTCTFVNQREPGTVTWEKVDKDEPAKHLAGSTWTLTAAGKPTITVTDCTQTNKCAGTNDTDPRAGYFSTTNLHYANYTLTETQAPTGYKRERATSTVNITATARTVALGTIPNIALKATINLAKRTVEAGGETDLPDQRAGWELGASLAAGTPATATLTANGAPTATQTTRADGTVTHPWNLTFGAETDSHTITLSEPEQEGWTPREMVCTNADGTQFHRADLSTAQATNGRYTVTLPALRPGHTIACVFTNEQTYGSVAWTKVDAGDNATLLAGSEWEIEHPDGTRATVTDCITDGECPDGSLDRDPAAGKFRIDQLTLGQYNLTETKAPAGFMISDEPTQAFTITAGQRDVVLKAIANERRPGINIPLTGGTAADAYLITGLALMAGSAGAAVMLMRRRRNTPGA